MAERIDIKPRRINYESDFDFMLWFVREGADGWPERFFPDYDFTGVLSCGRRFVFSRRGERYVNCRREGDGLRVICDNHELGPGTVALKIMAELPDGIYGDGYRRVVSDEPTPIILVRGRGDEPSKIDIALTVPFIFRSAYDMAVDAGFEGTEEEFGRATAMIPAAVDMLNRIEDKLPRIEKEVDRLSNEFDRFQGADLPEGMSAEDGEAIAREVFN